MTQGTEEQGNRGEKVLDLVLPYPRLKGLGNLQESGLPHQKEKAPPVLRTSDPNLPLFLLWESWLNQLGGWAVPVFKWAVICSLKARRGISKILD